MFICVQSLLYSLNKRGEKKFCTHQKFYCPCLKEVTFYNHPHNCSKERQDEWNSRIEIQIDFLVQYLLIYMSHDKFV